MMSVEYRTAFFAPEKIHPILKQGLAGTALGAGCDKVLPATALIHVFTGTESGDRVPVLSSWWGTAATLQGP